MSKVIVTGGAGFIGSHLTDALIKRGERVIIIDNLSTGKEKNLNPKADFYKVDICDFEKIKPLFKGVEFVFHLAAIPRMPLSIEKPLETSKTNIIGTISILKAAAKARVKRVVFASSSAVYGPQKKLPLKEDMPPNPISPYGLQKWVGERFAQIFQIHWGLPVVSLRYFNVYGPRIDIESDWSLVIGKFLRLRSSGQPLTIFGDGEQTRSFCYVSDVVEATIKASQAKTLKGGEVINIGSEKSISVNHIANLIGGEKIFLPKRAGDPEHTRADISRAKELLEWEPKISFEEGLKLTKEWFQNYVRTHSPTNPQ